MPPRIATLHNVCNSAEDDAEPTGEFVVADSVRKLTPSQPGEAAIYWESQGKDRMCALHCLNSLLQGPKFTEIDLSSVAMQLDEDERRLLYAATGTNEELSALLAGGSSNAADDGFFSIAVLEACLKQHGVVCRAAAAGVSDPTKEEALLCNLQEHWFAVRKLRNQWYNLDSLKPAPTKLGEFYLSAFLRDMMDRGYSVFVVGSQTGSPLPTPNKALLKRPLNPNQFYLTDTQIDDLIRMNTELHRRALEAETAKFGDGAPQTKDAPSYVWPTEGGRRLDGSAGLQSAQTDETDMPELAEALKLSLASFVSNLPKPADEPSEGAEGVITLQVRLPDQKRLVRRFRSEDTATDVCRWIELEAASIVGASAAYQLVADYPRRLVQRMDRCSVELHREDKSEDISVRSLKETFQSREQLFLKLV